MIDVPMTADPIPAETRSTPSGSGQHEESAATTRRTFMRGAAKRALYVTPVIMTVAASQARAGSAGDYDSACQDLGSPCTTDADCCPGLGLMCIGGEMFCMG